MFIWVVYQKKDTDHVNWVCSPCLTKLRLYLREGGVTKKLEDLRVNLEEKLGEVNSKVDQVQEVLIKVEKIAEQPTSSFLPSFPPRQVICECYEETPTRHEIYGRFTESNREKK